MPQPILWTVASLVTFKLLLEDDNLEVFNPISGARPKPKEPTSIRVDRENSIHADLNQRGHEKLTRADLDRREHLSPKEPTSVGEDREKSIHANLGRRECKKLTGADLDRR